MPTHEPTLTPSQARGPHPAQPVQIGFWIASEEHGPNEIIRAAHPR